MTFLPQDYKAPQTSNFYLKLPDGEVKIRIMSKPIFGWEEWDATNRPVRYRMDKKPLRPMDSNKPIRHFWSFIVFNYSEEQIQIMHITQNTIRKSIEALCRDSDWGDPYYYDIKITKDGKGLDTEYTVNPIPHKPLDEYLIKLFKEKPCNLDALFTNADPFSAEWAIHTPLGIEAIQEELSAVSYVTKEQSDDLDALIKECDPEKQDAIKSFLSRVCENTNDWTKMKSHMFEKMRNLVEERSIQYAKVAGEMPF